MKSRAGAAAALAFLLFGARTAGAQLGADGELIRTNSYSIDLYTGPVLASSRVTGLAGAFVAMAEGVDGDLQNPASPAVRFPYSRSFFDYDLGVGISFPGARSNTDFFNSSSGQTGLQSDFLFVNFALNLQFGRWGFGLTTDLQQFSLDRSESADVGVRRDQLASQVAVARTQLAYGFADNQLVVGVGSRTGTLSVTNDSANQAAERDLFSTVGAGIETGFVWKPNDYQFRIGGAFRSAITTQAEPGSRVRVLYPGEAENELWLPEQVSLPWDLNLGVAVQFGPRPLNPRWVDPDELLVRVQRYLAWRVRERERRRQYELDEARRAGRDVAAVRAALDTELSMQEALDQEYLARSEALVDRKLAGRYAEMRRFHVLVMASLLISGSVDDAVGVESFLERRVQRSGESVSLSPRAAVETEAIPHWTRLRGGYYFEPSRFETSLNGARQHFTAGFDQKLFPWTVFGLFEEGTAWRAGGAIDLARDYLGWGIAVGIWH
ncbi:MAG TPA: hypothetical protein VM686_20390 [Polyangiaceae bacterium]|nr:hypothetical protein [Polyangiaceae bacterium]